MAKRQKRRLVLCPGPQGPNLLHYGVSSYTKGHSLCFSHISVVPWVMVGSGEGLSGHTRCPYKKTLLHETLRQERKNLTKYRKQRSCKIYFSPASCVPSKRVMMASMFMWKDASAEWFGSMKLCSRTSRNRGIGG